MTMEELQMRSETIRFFIVATIWVLALFGAALLLTGCAELSTVAKCAALQSTSNKCS